jgi:hypothetical protein
MLASERNIGVNQRKEMERLLFYFALATVGFFLLNLGLFFYLFLRIKKIQKFADIFFKGEKAESLEENILGIGKRIKELDHDIEDLYKASNHLSKEVKKSFCKLGLIKFNPFGEKGHKGCFSLALLNGKKQGITLSTLSADNGVKIFAKTVSNGKSEILLTQEEKTAIKTAEQH